MMRVVIKVMSQSKPRLDKNHGFLHHIKRNQLERRDYHEEKLKDQEKKEELRSKEKRGRDSKSRQPRDDRRHQRRPNNRHQMEENKREYMDKPDKDGVVFTLSVEYCPDKIAVLKVKQKDDPDTIAKQFTRQYGMREDLTLALTHIISQKMGLQ